MHLHNSDMLTFLKAHADNPNIRKIIAEENQKNKRLNDELGEDYKDYFDYLERNSGDDANITMAQLKGLLKPRFTIELSKDERKDFEYKRLSIAIDDLDKPVYIKDEGDFFTTWDKNERIDIPLRFLKRFVKFLEDNNIAYDSEIPIYSDEEDDSGYRTIKLAISRKGDSVVCPDLATVTMVLGSRAAAGNLKLYGVRKEEGSYVVPVDSICKRIAALEERKFRIEEYLNIMKQVV